jgi:opacity protein-like surface antigen
MKSILLAALVAISFISAAHASDTPGVLIVNTTAQPFSTEGPYRVYSFTNTFNPNVAPNDWKVKKIQIVRTDKKPADIWVYKASDNSVVMVSTGSTDVQEFTSPDYVFLQANNQLKVEATGEGQFLVYVWYSLFE